MHKILAYAEILCQRNKKEELIKFFIDTECKFGGD